MTASVFADERVSAHGSGWGLYEGKALTIVDTANGPAVGFPDAEAAIEEALAWPWS